MPKNQELIEQKPGADGRVFILILLATAVVGGAIAAWANTDDCQNVFSVVANKPAETAWRAAMSHQLSGSSTVKSSARREQWLQKTKEAMLKFLNEKRDTPEMVFAVEEGVISQVAEVAYANPSHNPIPLNFAPDLLKQAFHYERVPRIQVSGLGNSGQLRGTLLLPVSGHTGLENAKKWAKTDTYEIYVEDEAHRRVATLAKSASLDMITAQDVELTLEPNKIYRLLYSRSGSGGPGGYPNGRTYEITWDGN